MGTILALTSITMANGVTMHGAALARSGDVTLIHDTITNTCSASPGASPSAGASPMTGQSTTPAPTSTVRDGSTDNSTPLLPLMIVLALAGLVLGSFVTQRRRIRR
jgi:hypothetical protein